MNCANIYKWLDHFKSYPTSELWNSKWTSRHIIQLFIQRSLLHLTSHLDCIHPIKLVSNLLNSFNKPTAKDNLSHQLHHFNWIFFMFVCWFVLSKFKSFILLENTINSKNFKTLSLMLSKQHKSEWLLVLFCSFNKYKGKNKHFHHFHHFNSTSILKTTQMSMFFVLVLLFYML